MTAFKLRFPEGRIHELAKEYPAEYDKPMRDMQSAIRKQGWLTRDDLNKVRKWLKVPFPGKKTIDAPLQIVGATAIALATCNESKKWDALVKVRGVQGSVASSLLHWFAEGNYPIASKPALWSCNVAGSNDLSFWLDYTKFCRELAEKNGVSMRALDRALVQYHGEKH